MESEIGLQESNEEFNFTLKLKNKDLSYGLSDYPESITFILEVSAKSERDLIDAMIHMKNQTSESIIYFLSYDMKKAIHIDLENDLVLESDFFHFERSFDLKKRRLFLISFNLSQIKEKQPLWLTIDSRQFGNKPVKFNLNKFEIYK